MENHDYEDFGTGVKFPKRLSVVEPLRVRTLLSAPIELKTGVELDLKAINIEGDEPVACYQVTTYHHFHTGQTRGKGGILPPNLKLKNDHDFFVLLSLEELENYLARLHELSVAREKLSTLRKGVIKQLVAIGEVVEA
jgi:hypothetical protein